MPDLPKRYVNNVAKKCRQKWDGTKSYRQYHRLYGLAAWRKLRIRWLLYHPLCIECQRQGIVTIATQVDHKQDHKGNIDLFFDEGNLQSLCDRCHSIKTRATTMPINHSDVME